MSRDDKKEVTPQFDYFKLFKVISYILVAVSVVFSVFVAISGFKVYTKYGFYPRTFSEIASMRRGLRNSLYVGAPTGPFAYMKQVAGGVVGVIFCINLLLADIINFEEEVRKGVVAAICYAVLIGLAIFMKNADTNVLIILLIAVAVCMVVLFFCFADTEGGKMICIALGAPAVDLLLIPLIMKLCSPEIRQTVIMVFAGAVWLCIFAVVGKLLWGFLNFLDSFGDSGSSPAAPPVDRSRNDDKIRREIEALDRRIRDSERGIQEHNKGSWNYAHVDEKATRRQIDEDIKRKRMLEEQLNKK